MSELQDLRETRRQLGWTQERMARELSVSLRTYCRQEAAGGDQKLRKLAAFVQKYTEPDAILATPPQQATEHGHMLSL